MTTITDTDLLAQTVTMTGDMRRNADCLLASNRPETTGG